MLGCVRPSCAACVDFAVPQPHHTDQDLKLCPLILGDVSELARSESLWLQVHLKGPEISGEQAVDVYDERNKKKNMDA